VHQHEKEQLSLVRNKHLC